MGEIPHLPERASAVRQPLDRHFYLYNPRGSEKFCFLPWDWDLAFDFEPVPANTLDPEALERRLAFGYGRGRASVFLSRYYRLPGIHAAIPAKADELRRDVLSDAAIAERAARYTAVVKPVASHAPDRST